MRITKVISLLVLICSFCSFSLAQFTINQEITWDPLGSPGCYNTIINSQDGTWEGAFVDVAVTHNLPTSGNPFIEFNQNQMCKRYMHFDFYLVDGTNEIFQYRVTEYDEWLIPSNETYSLEINDLAGLPEGRILVKLVVEYVHTSNSPVDTDLRVAYNGAVGCIELDFANQTLICDTADIFCFSYIPCGEVTVIPLAYICPLPGGGTAVCYDLDASISNGSGSYTWSWKAEHGSNTYTGDKANFSFRVFGPGRPDIYLYVTDDITGCEYNWQSMAKKPEGLGLQSEGLLLVSPNPILSGRSTHLQFVTFVEGDVNIALYDLQGREIQTLFQKSAVAEGLHELDFVPQVAAGNYLVRMESAEGILTQKLIVQQ